jgi:uncharacterized protein (TIGR00369 family)
MDEAGAAVARFVPERKHQGWSGIVHGGILSALLDEAMAQRLRFAGVRAVTAGLSVRFKRPVPTTGTWTVRGELLDDRSRLLHLRAGVYDEQDTLHAEAEGTFLRLRGTSEG